MREEESEPQTQQLKQAPEPQVKGSLSFEESRASKPKKQKKKAVPKPEDEVVRRLDDGPIDIQTRSSAVTQ